MDQKKPAQGSLPEEAQSKLKRAFGVARAQATEAKRQAVIDGAIEWVKSKYPDFFKRG